MGRGRIAMEPIQKEKSRKTTFQKRKSGLLKKVYEFSTLCGVDTCVIIYAPADFESEEGGGVGEPEIWPKDIKEVERIIQKYYNTTSDRRPKIYDVEEYYKEKMKKVEAEVAKVSKEMVKAMYPTWDDSFNTLGEEDLRMFASILDAKLDACNQRIDMLKGGGGGVDPIPIPNPKGGSHHHEINNNMVLHQHQHQQQFTDHHDPFLASNIIDPNSHFNLMQNNNNMLPQMLPPFISYDHNMHPLAFWQQFQMGSHEVAPNSHSQPPPPPPPSSLQQQQQLHFGQNGMTDWVNNEVGAVHDHKIGMKKEDYAGGADQNHHHHHHHHLQNSSSSSSSPYYYNGNTQVLDESSSYSIPSQTLSNLPPPPPPGFQF